MSTHKGQIVKDITGLRVGSLVVIGRDMTKERNYWLVQCDCGNVKSIFRGHLTKGRINNCGCKTVEIRRQNLKTHGESKTRLFGIWLGIHARCYNKYSFAYEWYGKRGIKICDEWLKNYVAFRDWALSNGYQDDLTIDRIDTNGNYEPSNCRWATAKEQANNTRNNHRITYNGESHTMAEWAEIKGFPIWTIINRLKYGWTINRIMETPVKIVNKYLKKEMGL
jgi:hypothetical protein